MARYLLAYLSTYPILRSISKVLSIQSIRLFSYPHHNPIPKSKQYFPLGNHLSSVLKRQDLLFAHICLRFPPPPHLCFSSDSLFETSISSSLGILLLHPATFHSFYQTHMLILCSYRRGVFRDGVTSLHLHALSPLASFYDSDGSSLEISRPPRSCCLR